MVLVRLALSYYVRATMRFILRMVSCGVRGAEAPLSLTATHVRRIILSLLRRVALATCTVAVIHVYHYCLCSLLAHISCLFYWGHPYFSSILQAENDKRLQLHTSKTTRQQSMTSAAQH